MHPPLGSTNMAPPLGSLPQSKLWEQEVVLGTAGRASSPSCAQSPVGIGVAPMRCHSLFVGLLTVTDPALPMLCRGQGSLWSAQSWPKKLLCPRLVGWDCRCAGAHSTSAEAWAELLGLMVPSLSR